MFLQGKEIIRFRSKKKNCRGKFIDDESIIRIEFTNNCCENKVSIIKIEVEHFEIDDEEFSVFIDNVIKGLKDNKDRIIKRRELFNKLTEQNEST